MKKTLTFFPFALITVTLALAAVAEEKTAPKLQPRTSTPALATPVQVATNNSAADNFPVICYIEKQDRTITAKASPKGTVYSVKTRDGKALCENISLEQLRAQAPELHDFIRSAIVLKSDKSEKRGKSDASLRMEAIR
jgi:hypothetical protein